MTSKQEKQVTDALVAFVLTVTDGSHLVDRSEAMVLPAMLDFLMMTNSPERLYKPIRETMIDSAILPDLHKMIKKFVESKE